MRYSDSGTVQIGNPRESKLFRLTTSMSIEPIIEVFASSPMEAHEIMRDYYRTLLNGEESIAKIKDGLDSGRFVLRMFPNTQTESVNPVSAPQSLPTKQTGGIHVYRNAFPDGDLTLSKHYGEREAERSVSYEEIVDMISRAKSRYGDKIAAITDTNFIIKRREGGMGIAIQKRERPDGTQMYRLATAYPQNFRYGPEQTVFWI